MDLEVSDGFLEGFWWDSGGILVGFCSVGSKSEDFANSSCAQHVKKLQGNAPDNGLLKAPSLRVLPFCPSL